MNNLVDVSELLKHYEGDCDLVMDLVEVFEETYTETMQDLERACNEKKFQEIEVSAHTLKGMISNFFANAIREKAALLEKMGQAHRIDNAQEIVTEIKELIPLMLNEIKTIESPGESRV